MKKGDVITEDAIMSKRPGTGISPKFSDVVINKRMAIDATEDMVITWDMI
jgi:N-acetylneuraminate synthase